MCGRGNPVFKQEMDSTLFVYSNLTNMDTQELNIGHIIKKEYTRQEQTETFRFWVGFYVIQLVEKKPIFSFCLD